MDLCSQVFWYLSLMGFVLGWDEGRGLEQMWAQRLLFIRNIFMGFVGLGATAALYQSYTAHSEEGFAATMGFLNGLVLLIICFCCDVVKIAGSRGLPIWLVDPLLFYQ